MATRHAQGRAPLTGEGRSTIKIRFQSAPLTEARGDSRGRDDSPAPKSYQTLPGFNPLPSPKRGEIGGRIDLRGRHLPCHVSIRSPHRSEGRCSLLGLTGLDSVVSIRSPHRSEGRCSIPPGAGIGGKVSIRSPHRSEGRSRTSTLRDPGRSFNPLPSPKSEGRLFQCAPLTDISIRSPHRSEGRSSRRTRSCFNPLPSPKRGEMRPGAQITGCGVSFQSAPLTEARGDAGCCNQQNNKGLHRPMRDSVKSLPGRA